MRGGTVGSIFLTKLRGPAKDVSYLSTVPDMTLGLSYDFRTPLQMEVLGYWLDFEWFENLTNLLVNCFFLFAGYNIVVYALVLCITINNLK